MTSGLEILTQIIGIQREWISCCIGGKNQEGQTQEGLLRPKECFSPFVLSVDGIMGKEALVVLTTSSRPMAAKMDEPIFHITGWVNRRIAFEVVRSYSRLLFVT